MIKTEFVIHDKSSQLFQLLQLECPRPKTIITSESTWSVFLYHRLSNAIHLKCKFNPDRFSCGSTCRMAFGSSRVNKAISIVKVRQNIKLNYCTAGEKAPRAIIKKRFSVHQSRRLIHNSKPFLVSPELDTPGIFSSVTMMNDCVFSGFRLSQ